MLPAVRTLNKVILVSVWNGINDTGFCAKYSSLHFVKFHILSQVTMNFHVDLDQYWVHAFKRWRIGDQGHFQHSLRNEAVSLSLWWTPTNTARLGSLWCRSRRWHYSFALRELPSQIPYIKCSSAYSSFKKRDIPD